MMQGTSVRANSPSGLTDMLAELVRAHNFSPDCQTLDRERKIAVHMVLFDKSKFLRKCGIQTEGSLKDLLQSAEPIVGPKWCEAVLAIRSQRCLRELFRGLWAVECEDSPIDEILAPCRGAVMAVMRNCDNVEALRTDDDWKRAIAKAIQIREAFDAVRVNHCLNRSAFWDVHSIMEEVDETSSVVFGSIETPFRKGYPKLKRGLADKMRKFRDEICQTPKEAYDGGEVEKLSDLLEAEADRLEKEAGAIERSAEYLGWSEKRGGKDHRRVYAIKLLARVFESAGKKASASDSPNRGNRNGPFVRFLVDVFKLYDRTNWVTGIGMAADRALKERKLKKAAK